MALNPVFASTPRYAGIELTDASGTTVSSAVLTGVTAGTRIREIKIHSGPTTAPGGAYKLYVYVSDGTNNLIVDVVTLTNSADTLQAKFTYDNLILPSSSHSIKFSVSSAITSGATLDCLVFGEDLT